MAEKRKIKPATLQNHLEHKSSRQAAGRLYAEDLPTKLGDAVDSADTLQSKLQNVGSLPPAERAEVGGAIGAHLGNKIAGAHGSLIGAAIGSDATRSLGVAQSGEKEISDNQEKVLQTLQTAKVVTGDKKLKFKDGGEIDLSDLHTEQFPNTAPNIVGKPSRGALEPDPTNPFTARTKAVVKPLAYYVVGGLMGQSDLKDKSVLKTVDNTAAMLTNALQVGAKDIGSVYERAKEIAKKVGGTDKQMKQFFFDHKSSLSAQDAGDIKQGLEILYGK